MMKVKNMEEKSKKQSKKWLIALVVIILVVVIGVALYFIFTNINGGIRKETFTEENYQELMNRIGEELKDSDDLYYISYSAIYYMTKDGLSSALAGNNDEKEMYKSFFGKTVQDMINEGKNLMKENNVSIDEYKKQIENTIVDTLN